jgi:predicted Zn finger-like uncharacterized protein
VKEGKETAKLGGARQTPAKPGDTGVVPPQWRFTSAVRAIRYSPAGDRLLVGGGPRTLGIFDAATHKEVAIFWDGPPSQGVLFAAQDAQHNDGVLAKDEEKPKPPPRNWPERVDIPFDKGADAQSGLHLFGPIDAANVKGEPQGLRLTLPATRDNLGDVGVEARKVLRGDFEITLAYDLVAIATPAPKWGAGVILQIRLDTPDDAMANVTRTFKGKGASFGSSYFAVGDAGTHVRQPLQYPQANAKIRSGRLRLTRTGNDLAFQVDEGGGFRVIASKEVGGADVVSVHVLATTGKEPFPVDVRFPSLELRWDPASKVAAAPPVLERAQEKPPSRGWLAAAAIVVGLMAVSIVGWFFLSRLRRGTHQPSPRETAKRNGAEGATPPSGLALVCPGCQRKIRVKAEQAGKKVKCPHCAAAALVPSLTAKLPTPRGQSSTEEDAES